MAESLFGHLVLRFGSSPENLATEALNFILNHSHIARESFISFLQHLDIPISSTLFFETQNMNEDGSIPDMIGKDSNGKTIILGEAKFWAGLTENQPVAYINQLTKSNGTLLLFFSPAKRLVTLWPELLRRCNNAAIKVIIVDREIHEIKIAKIQESQYLVLISWKVLLDSLRRSLEREGDWDMTGNIVQLQGLCEYMDSTGFLPLQSEELTSIVGSRMIQYCDIVDEVIDHLVSEKYISLIGVRATPVRTGYKRYFHNNPRIDRGYSLEFNPRLWSKYRATPIWLGIYRWVPKQSQYDPEARERLGVLEREVPSCLFREGDSLYVPIYLMTGLEKAS
jgi:hypothetical protein